MLYSENIQNANDHQPYISPEGILCKNKQSTGTAAAQEMQINPDIYKIE